MREDHEQFSARGSQIVAVNPERAEAVTRYWREHRLPFVGLADPDHEVADLYEQPVRLLKLGRLPAVFVINRRGTIRFEHFASSMRDIPSTEDLLAALDAL